MLTVVLIMTAGIALGYFIRNRKHIVRISDSLTMWAIYLLLFLLGVAIGTNKTIVKNLPVLGLKALLISIGGIVGSVLLALIVYHLLIKPKQSNNEE
jgi:uncharacterized membrane protein YbjE (DUF340 family)